MHRFHIYFYWGDVIGRFAAAVSQNPVRFGGQVRCARQGASGFLTDINPNFGMIHY